jgi:23S rRNA 5-hydroxycytidine C2501 synthase
VLPHHLELLSPARDADIGIEAIRHGADAVYIGGPAFGARASAGNSVSDIARLVSYAQRFHARIFVTMNTIFDDHEIEPARALCWDLYEAGVDALIVQDMGLLMMDMPPIQLHASTQTDIRDADKARFLQDVGFSQIVLARELDVHEIRRIRAATRPDTVLEFFIHGALCVAFSGQCYISHAHTGRSANRGECSQACRLPYTLEDHQGRIVAYDKHLLSMKDNDQSANLRALIDAGIRSFKIEGRYKDMAYVKNSTAHYRQLLDGILLERSDLAAASSGRVTHHFTPQPEKTFNRSTTDYFVNGRHASDIGAFDTPKFSGEPIGHVSRVSETWFEVDSDVELHNGDGLSYQPPTNKGANKLAGMRINTVASGTSGPRLTPNEMPTDLRVGLMLYRNRDQAFERALEKDSAVRRIGVTMHLSCAPDQITLTMRDENGYSACVSHACEVQTARDEESALTSLRTQLAKLGTTDFVATDITIEAAGALCFVPASAINAIRRLTSADLAKTRAAARPRLIRAKAAEPPARYPAKELSYLGNVFNQHARDFYAQHGVELIADAYEANTTPGDVSLMITKHCLRYSFNLCPKEAKDWQLKGVKAEPMTLVNGSERLTLKFDCKACEMHVIGPMKKQRVIPILPVAQLH